MTNPMRGWQLDLMVRPVLRLITTFTTTFGKWLQGKLSKHNLGLTTKFLANPRGGWQLESMVRPVEGLITWFMATLSRWLQG